MVKVTVARENTDSSCSHGRQYYDYVNYEVRCGNIDDYLICRRIAGGKYSEVFEGRVERTGRKCIIKVLKPIRQCKINREVKILKTLKHGNIIELLDVVVDSVSKTYSLLFEYQNHSNTATLFRDIDICDIRHYSRQILDALRYSHNMGVIHRDLKPQNILVDPSTKALKIIDWGMAEFYLPKTSYPVKVGTRSYKAPEILVGYGFYDYSLDMWAFGCILAEMLFKRRPFFHGEDNVDQLVKIVDVLGTGDLYRYTEEYEISLSDEIKSAVVEKKKVALETFLSPNLRGTKPYTDCLDLLEKLLVFDHHVRMTASESLESDFFVS